MLGTPEAIGRLRLSVRFHYYFDHEGDRGGEKSDEEDLVVQADEAVFACRDLAELVDVT